MPFLPPPVTYVGEQPDSNPGAYTNGLRLLRLRRYPGQLSLPSLRGRQMSNSYSWGGMAHSDCGLNVRASKTVRSLDNTCHT